jgi:hypothetical protein
MADTPEDQTVIVVGAGFSAALTGGNNPMIGNGPLPTLQRLGKELSQFAHDSNKRWDAEGQFSDKTIGHGLTLLKQTFEADSNPDTNFEQFISMLASQKSFLEQFPSANRPDLPQNDPYVLDFIIFLLCQFFERLLGVAQSKLVEKFSTDEFLYAVNSEPRLKEFTRCLYELMTTQDNDKRILSVNFVSLNYDGILEAVTEKVNDFVHYERTYYRYRSHVIPLGDPYRGIYQHMDGMSTQMFCPRILKPHGSIHFYKLRGNIKSIVGGSGFAGFIPTFRYSPNPIRPLKEPRDSSLHFEATPFIVPPVLNKETYMGSEYFTEMLFHVHRAITKARNIVVIGFSLPPSDLHLWAALQSIDWTDKRVFICDIEKEDGDAFKNWSRVARGAKVELLPFEGLPCDTEANIKNFFDDLKKRIH